MENARGFRTKMEDDAVGGATEARAVLLLPPECAGVAAMPAEKDGEAKCSGVSVRTGAAEWASGDVGNEGPSAALAMGDWLGVKAGEKLLSVPEVTLRVRGGVKEDERS
jgi:hypothetical protein